MTRKSNLIRKWIIEHSNDSALLTDQSIVDGIYAVHNVRVSKSLVYKVSGSLIQRSNLSNPVTINAVKQLLKLCDQNPKLARLLINYVYQTGK
jgi:hypothetical protein